MKDFKQQLAASQMHRKQGTVYGRMDLKSQEKFTIVRVTGVEDSTGAIRTFRDC